MGYKTAHDEDLEETSATGRSSSGQPTEPTTHADGDLLDVMRRVARMSSVPQPALLPRLGQVLDTKYKVDACIGRGGMGAVYRATHLRTGKSVALKWMLHAGTDPTAQRRFLREAAAAGRIDHPNVVDVYDVGEEGGSTYLVMELLRGETLSARLRRGALQVSEAIEILLPAMRGVSAAHREGVIHRDLKPDNIFLCQGPDGSARAAKVLDFGIASVRTCSTEPTLTSQGVVLGTPAYMSPEQLQAAREVDARTDVYAFGVILYEALAGTRPFEAKSYSGLVLAIVQQAPKPPSELAADLPPALEAIVLRALAKSRDDRYASIDDMIAALEEFTEACGATFASSSSRPRLPLKAAKPGAVSRLGWVAASLAALACAVVLGALWFSTSTTQRTSGQRPRAPLSVPAAAPESYGLPATELSGAVAARSERSEPSLHPEPKGAVQRSCEHARLAGANQDGPQHIDPDGPDGRPAFEVFCAGMSTVSAREYLTLSDADSGETERNVTRYVHAGSACACPDLTLRFQRVRLDPRTLSIDPTDTTFAVYDRPLDCEKQHASQCGDMLRLTWGGAGSCRAAGDRSGSASIDLRDTPFALADEQPFVPAGFGAAGSATISSDRKSATLNGGGLCGSMVAKQGRVSLTARP